MYDQAHLADCTSKACIPRAHLPLTSLLLSFFHSAGSVSRSCQNEHDKPVKIKEEQTFKHS